MKRYVVWLECSLQKPGHRIIGPDLPPEIPPKVYEAQDPEHAARKCVFEYAMVGVIDTEGEPAVLGGSQQRAKAVEATWRVNVVGYEGGQRQTFRIFMRLITEAVEKKDSE